MSNLEKYTVNILKDVEDRFFDIPFENSFYQNKLFVISAEQTPARAYRAIGLRMLSKIRALKEVKLDMQLAELDIEENKYKISLDETSSFDKRRLEIKCLKIESESSFTKKLINDAIVELDFLYEELKKYHRYNREEFEAEEETHFQLSMENQIHANGNGAVISLQNMHQDKPKLDKMLKDSAYLSNIMDNIKEETLLVQKEVL